MTQVTRLQLLQLYKNLLRCAEGVGKEARDKQIQDVKEIFQRLRSESAESVADAVYEEGKRKLSFLRIVSTTRRSSFQPEELKARYVYRDGQLVSSDGPNSLGRAYNGNYSVTSEDIDRHKQLLRRQHFMDRKSR
eukprot:TRINITY_DN5029_c0_g1_i1.p1 TRINITY_DN5029_c0_g1~~TRINITY_DN5029_c0_g1_i1.p1  ORF type:complete len:135 (+),score=28.03 TRINITY_DN5029_c0_g1_i1:66-470(+)